MNQFNLDNSTLTFTPAAPNAAQYSYSVAPQGYDSAAASQGTPLAALDDDDTRLAGLPFAFPFFGATYNQVFVNSDGNLTFTVGDFASTDRSLGRMTAGPPRISPLFDDLNPSQTAGGVRVFGDASARGGELGERAGILAVRRRPPADFSGEALPRRPHPVFL